jgi:hypothetical protein
MYEWSESQQTIREMVRRFVEQEVVPHVQALEHGDLPPYGILRKMYAAFGMSEMARARFRKQIEAEKAGEPRQKKGGGGGDPAARADQAAATLIPIIELCRSLPRHGHRHGRVDGPDVRRHPLEGHDRPEGALGPRPAHPRQDRRLGDHRARLRLRRLRFA